MPLTIKDTQGPSMPPQKPSARSARKLKSCRLDESIVLKANIIVQVEGGNAADLLSDLIEAHTPLDQRYAEALKKLQARQKKS